MSQQHILVVGYLGLGHAIPTLDTVAELVARGHEVTYLTAGGAVAPVARTGATVVAYDSVLAGVDPVVMDTPRRGDELLPLGVEEDRALIAAALRHLGSDRPDLVIYDTTRVGAGRILGRAWDVPIAQFCPVLVSNEHFSFDASTRHKRGQPARGRHPYVARALRGFVALLAEHGQSDRKVEEFVERTEGLNLVLFPRSFQFAGDTFDDRYVFVGPNLTDGADPGDWRAPAGGRPVLTIALGSQARRGPSFFRGCVEAFRDTEWHVVLQLHASVDLDVLGALPPNVEVHRWLPQLAVLEHTDVLLCHGGMGTLMTAFATATPVVVVPNTLEQMVNADRVLELGLGRVLAEDAVSAESLRGAVREVTADPRIREQVTAMRADVREAGGGPRAADAIEGYLKTERDGQNAGRS